MMTTMTMKMNSFESFSEYFLPGSNLWTPQITFFCIETSKVKETSSIRAAAAVVVVAAVVVAAVVVAAVVAVDRAFR